nr:reverse transcriptase domain-containing protein [Tanacetum cinerariifolium]
MQTRSSSRLVSDQSTNPTSSTNTNLKGRNRKRCKQRIVNSNLEEHSHPVVTMADQRTMAQLLQAPSEGYEDAIVVPTITADNFELKHAAAGNFLDKMPRDCLSIIESKSKLRYSRDKPVVAKVSTNASTSGVSPDVAELKDMVKALLLDKKAVQSKSPVSTEPAIAPVSASKPNPKALIPYPSRRNDERNHEQANNQIEKFYQIFKDMSFEISFADALILMPKFASTLKALIRNKEKLSEMARTPLNKHCCACMRTRRSYFPPTSTIPCRSRKQTTNVVELEFRTIIETADNRTMAQMLQAPIEGYEDAIVVPQINANNFELKQTLINLVQSNQFTGRQDPHNHLRFFNKVTSTFRHPECPHHGFSELHKLDTFYNALNPNDQDALDSAAGGNFLDKIPHECLSIIESKSKVRYSRSRVTDVRATANAPFPSTSPSNSFDLQQIPASLKDKLDIRMNRFDKSLNNMKNSFITPTAPLKAVEEVCVTCGANHSYNQCPLTRENDFPVFHDNIQQF